MQECNLYFDAFPCIHIICSSHHYALYTVYVIIVTASIFTYHSHETQYANVSMGFTHILQLKLFKHNSAFIVYMVCKRCHTNMHEPQYIPHISTTIHCMECSCILLSSRSSHTLTIPSFYISINQLHSSLAVR